MTADFYRVAFWAISATVISQAFFLHVDASNINDLKARVTELESSP